MSNIKISIIVPVYQAEKHLEQCLDSLVNQTYVNLEIILVDDGSHDNSLAICNQYKDKDQRIIVVHQDNAGVSTARNVGINKASGEYIYFVDSDDWIEINTIEELVRDVEENALDCVGFNYLKEYEGKTVKNKNYFLEEKIYIDTECKEILRLSIGLIEDELKHIEFFNFLASPCSKIYKRAIIVENNIHFKDIKEIGSFEDGLFNIQFLSHCNSYKYKNKYYYHYRKTNGQSITSSYRKEMLKKQLMQLTFLREIVDINRDNVLFKAYENRIAFMAMEFFINAVTNTASFKEKYCEIKSLFKVLEYVSAIREFSLKYLSRKWKIYYFFIKKKMTFLVYVLSSVILRIKQRIR